MVPIMVPISLKKHRIERMVAAISTFGFICRLLALCCFQLSGTADQERPENKRQKTKGQ